ncbi:MAG: isovaleryl-CoA dehydrogenase, partial [Rhizobiales bacterium]|nr:isovaleryl-CoA dehydrogenase [Hyphomicrobiales bacterium]
MIDAALTVPVSEEIAALQQSVRRWAADKLAPRAAQIDQSNKFARDLWPELGALGLLGITAPEDHGG